MEGNKTGQLKEDRSTNNNQTNGKDNSMRNEKAVCSLFLSIKTPTVASKIKPITPASSGGEPDAVQEMLDETGRCMNK